MNLRDLNIKRLYLKKILFFELADIRECTIQFIEVWLCVIVIHTDTDMHLPHNENVHSDKSMYAAK